MQNYKKVTAYEVPKQDIGTKVEGIFETFIGFINYGKFKLCIGPTGICLPQDIVIKYVKTERMLEKLAYFLEFNNIKTKVKGVIIPGNPMLTLKIDEGEDYLDYSPCIQAETFEPECGLEAAIKGAKAVTQRQLDQNVV